MTISKKVKLTFASAALTMFVSANASAAGYTLIWSGSAPNMSAAQNAAIAAAPGTVVGVPECMRFFTATWHCFGVIA